MTQTMELEGGRRSVLGRAFDLLDCFSGPEPEQTISSLCEQTGLPAVTVHRLLATLVEWGAVERSGRGRYRLGRWLWRLGWGVPHAREVRDVARPHMVDLYAATGKIVLLGSRDGDSLLLIDQIAGSATGIAWRSTRPRPLGSCAAGLIFLAHMELDVLRSRLAESSLGLPEPLRREEFLLLQVLAEIRSTGIAHTSHGDRRWLSAPVYDADGRLRSTLSLLVPADDAALSRHAQLVARAARAVSMGLGFCRSTA